MSGMQGTAHGANATLMQGLERRWIAQSRAGNYIQKEEGHCTVVCGERGGFAAQQAAGIGLLDWLAPGARGPGSEAPGY